MKSLCPACGNERESSDSFCKHCGAARSDLTTVHTDPCGHVGEPDASSNVEDKLREALAPSYQLIKKLGERGMGSVFLARDPTLKRMIAVKVLFAEIEHIYRPKVVRPIKIGKTAIEADLKLSTMVYLLAIALLFAIGTVLLMVLEAGNGIDITTAATASVATLNNIGPGLARVGATENYAWFSAPGKLVMSALMLLGRLEMFTILVLFSPRFWRTE